MTDELKQRIYDGMAKVSHNAEVAARFLGERKTFVFTESMIKDYVVCFFTYLS